VTGARMQQEMAEQPAVLRSLLRRRPALLTTLRAAAPTPLRGVVLVARGSSDNAAVHARYLLEWAVRVPVALAAPSLQTRYGVTPALDGFVAVGVSQSGATPEIVETLTRLGAGGARTVAVTNVADSPLAREAAVSVLLEAGEERAVPATKTFTAQLAALCMLTEALADGACWPASGWSAAVDAVEAVLGDGAAGVEAVAADLADADAVVPVGRGFLYGAALEVGLKLAETTGLPVLGTSPADLWHGPIASVHRGTHALCLASPGPVLADVRAIAADLAARGAPVSAVASADAPVPAATRTIPVPAGVPEPLAALPQVVRGQQLAHRAARRRGIDPDRPFALRKITPTT
jgi:glutamine---fructose-6-phosphate transaminase (isomerizing)